MQKFKGQVKGGGGGVGWDEKEACTRNLRKAAGEVGKCAHTHTQE